MAITSKCTLACGHCYEWNNISASEALAVGDIMRIVDKVKGSGVRHIQLSGGEPLERFEDLLKIIKYASRGADVWILTSGYGLTREKAALMRKAGLTGADISLDHWDAREHNRSRNNPRAFAWVREAVRNCNETGLVTALSLCAFKEFVSADNLARYIDCARRWNSGFIRLLEPRRAGKFLDRNVELEEDQFKLLEAFFQETNISPEYSGFPIITFPSWTQRRTGCLGAGNRYLYIDSKGEFHACPFCQRSAGNAVSSGMDEAISLLRKYGCQKYVLNLAD